MVQTRNHIRSKTTYLDGESLTVESLFELSTGKLGIDLTPDAYRKIEEGRTVVDRILQENVVAYGINTGFGLFSNVIISADKLSELQENLIRSHAAGIGEPLSPAKTRMLLALRINVLAKGHSGIRKETVIKLIDAFNFDCLSVIPQKGTVGASGDLAPLAHLALGMMGEGMMWDVESMKIEKASSVLSRNGLHPVQLEAKEGLAMINGTQLISSIGAEATVRAENIAHLADVAVAFSLEVLKGTVNAFHSRIHEVRPHLGQIQVATRIRAYLQGDQPSELFKSHNYAGKVQDAYSLRCAPQIHGIVNDTIGFVKHILNTELNSATDNPMVFTGNIEASTDLKVSNTRVLTESLKAPDTLDEANRLVSDLKQQLASKPKTALKRTSDTFYRGGGGFIISGGNFHGEYPAKVLDFLGIAVHELGNVSERRIERLVNPSLSGLPAFLVEEGGLNSGFMIAHCTAAALVSENKVLCHPSSVDSISTSGSKEDHVSMGGFSARKALSIVEHVEVIIAIELLAACQALEFLRPLRTTKTLERVYETIRAHVPPYHKDRYMSPDIEAVARLIRDGTIVKSLPSVKTQGLSKL